MSWLSLLRNFSSALRFVDKGKFALVAAFLMVVLAPASAFAEAFLYEPFDYTVGSDLANQGSGVGFSSNWIDRNGIDPTPLTGGAIGAGLSYNDGTNDLQTSGGHYIHKRLDGSSSQYQMDRRFDVNAINASNPEVMFEDTTTYTPGFHIGKAGSTVWFSFLYQSSWDGSTNGGEGSNWGGVSFNDGDADGSGGSSGGKAFAELPADPNDPLSPTDPRTLRASAGRGDMGGEKASGDGDLRFTLNGSNGGSKSFDESGGPLVNADPPTLVLMRMDFRGDPTAPNGANEYHETWPYADQADEIRMWLNPSLTTEPANGTENAYMAYEGKFGDDIGGNFHVYTDRFDFKIDAISLSARADGTLYDEIRMGATFNDVTPIAGGTGPIAGDYDNDGFVGQSDLDLVLLNWGDTSPPAPAGWVNQVPAGLIGQGALDGVLLNWGNSASSQLVGVPEPTSLALALLGLCGIAASQRKRS